MARINRTEPDQSRLRRADKDAFQRMVKELGRSSGDWPEIWIVVRWMMKNIYDPNTKERLEKLLKMVEEDIETVKGDVGKLQDNVSGEIKSWIADIDESDDNSNEDLAEYLKRLKELSGQA